jgi:hypothetical protein
VYARAVIRPGRLVGVGITVAIVSTLSFAACQRASPQERAIDLCGDLVHLGETIAFLVDPPTDARVGQVRGSLDKLDPTFEGIEDVVAESASKDVRDAQDAYRDAISGVGDDHLLTHEDVPVAGPQRALDEAVAVVEAELRCEQLASVSPA